jgi:hypothetical protein
VSRLIKSMARDFPIAVVLLIGSMTTLASATSTADRPVTRLPAVRLAAERMDAAGDPKMDLAIHRVRLEPSATEASPAAVLRFDATNEGSDRLTDIVLEGAIEAKPDSSDEPRSRRLIAGPFTIQVAAILEAGYTIEYEVLLRNLSLECRCIPTVRVVSVRSLTSVKGTRNAIARVGHAMTFVFGQESRLR